MKKIQIFIAALILISTESFSQNLSKFHHWTKGEGPGAREHSITWVYDNNYFLYGGYGFSPFQGVPSTELWRLDLTNKKWKLLPTIGEAPGPSSRGIHVSKDGNELFVLATTKIFFGQNEVTQVYRLTIENNLGTWKRIPIIATSKANKAVVTNFLLRSINLSSLIYRPKSDSFYSVCSAENCNLYELTISDVALIKEVKVNGKIPKGRVAFSYGYSNKLDKLVISSGQNLLQGAQNVFYEDLHILDFNNNFTWSKLDNFKFKGRRNPCFGMNESKNQLYIWGGTSDGKTALDELFYFDLQTEKQVEIIEQSKAKPRSSCMAAYDKESESMLMGFGNTLKDQFLDLWTIK